MELYYKQYLTMVSSIADRNHRLCPGVLRVTCRYLELIYDLRSLWTGLVV